MKLAIPAPILLLTLLATAGCARDETVYPSLGKRPVEQLGFAEPETTPAVATADPALDAKIATLTANLATLTAVFAQDAGKAEAAARAARGKAVGSDAWLDAQSALATLDDHRAQTSALVTDIDQAGADRAQALAAEYPPLTALHDRAQAEADRESETIGRLTAMLPAA